MKKLMLIAAMVLGFAGMSFAQTTASTTAPITATVAVALSISEIGSIAFGTVYTGTAPNVSPYSATGVAAFTISGNPNTSVTINVDASDPLNPTSGTAPSLTFTPGVVGWATSTQPASGNAITSGNSYQLGAAGTGSNAGNFYLWVGGDISTIPASQPSGDYSGIVTVQVNY